MFIEHPAACTCLCEGLWGRREQSYYVPSMILDTLYTVSDLLLSLLLLLLLLLKATFY